MQEDRNMLVKDRQGREIEITVFGTAADDVQINEAFYLFSDEDVSESTIDYILDTYGAELEQEWFESQVSRADFLGE